MGKVGSGFVRRVGRGTLRRKVSFESRKCTCRARPSDRSASAMITLPSAESDLLMLVAWREGRGGWGRGFQEPASPYLPGERESGQRVTSMAAYALAVGVSRVSQ